MTVTAFSFVAMYDHALAATANVLEKGALHAASKGVAERDMLDWRLIEDMQPLNFQLAVICNFSRQWPARVAGLPVPEDTPTDLGLAAFKAAIADARAYLQTLEPRDFDGRDAVDLTYTIGTGMTLTRHGGQWLTIFATTNLYFHVATAYDILRSKGVEIGKVDMFAGGL